MNNDELRALAEAVNAGDDLAAGNWGRPEPSPDRVFALLDEIEFLKTDREYMAWDQRHSAALADHPAMIAYEDLDLYVEGTDDEPWTVSQPDPPADRRPFALAVIVIALAVVAIVWWR